MKKKIQKPFDAQAAKNGAVVETVDGNSVRILCYDRAECGYGYPIIALINVGGIESCHSYTSEGKLLRNSSDRHDLVIVEEVEYPKFKVGDWVIKDNGGRAWLITVITSDCYLLQDLQGHGARAHHGAVDTCSHLWTLDDARPGDVLVCKDDNRPFIFSGIYFDMAPTAYCGIDIMDFITIGSGGPWTHKPVRPATYKEKQQFFNRLEEEGYKWDARAFTLWKKCN